MTESEELDMIYASRVFRAVLAKMAAGLTDRMHNAVRSHKDREAGEFYWAIDAVRRVRPAIKDRIEEIQREVTNANSS